MNLNIRYDDFGHKYIIEPIVGTTKEKYDEIIFLLILIGITVVFWYESLSLRAATAQVPLITIVGSFIALSIGLLFIFYGSILKELTGLGAHDTDEDSLLDSLDTEIEESSGGFTGFASYKGFNITAALLELTWSVVYIIGVLYVGFFTTNFLFAAGYIFFNSTGDSVWIKAKEAIMWGVIFVIGAYVIFIYILGNSVIWHLGFFW